MYSSFIYFSVWIMVSTSTLGCKGSVYSSLMYYSSCIILDTSTLGYKGSVYSSIIYYSSWIIVDTSTLVIKEVFVLSQIRSEVQAPLPALSRSVDASASQRLVLGPGRQGRRRGEFHQTSLLKGISLPAAYRWKSKSKSTEIHTLCRLHCPIKGPKCSKFT